MTNKRSLGILRTILYVLSGTVFALGLIAGISLMGSASNISNVLMPFQFVGNGAIINLITPYLTSLLNGLGVFILVVSLVLSLLLFAIGRLLSYIGSLEVRLAQLEAQTISG